MTTAEVSGERNAPAAPASEPSAGPTGFSPAVLASALVLATLAAYLPALGAGYIWDDDYYVTNDANLRTLQGLRDIWLKPSASPQYYPLVFTGFWIEYHCWRLTPFGYHFFNVVLHALSALLLWRLLRALQVPGAWLAAAIFALHPVAVESVAWITERKNTLSAFFYLAAMLAYFRFDPPVAAGEQRRWGWYGTALFLFVAALLSKTVACSLPAALVVIFWWKRRRLAVRDLIPLSPFFVVGVVLALFTAWKEKYGVGAHGLEWSLTPVERCLVAGRVVWFYAAKLLWPLQLIFIYPRWQIDARAAWQYAFPLGLIAVIAALWLLRRRIGKGPLAAVLLFVGTLVPALGFFDVYPMRYSYVADHFQYLAMPAVIALAVATAAAFFLRFGDRASAAGRIVATAVLLTLGMLTWRQCQAYKDRRTLWEDTLAKNPGCWMARYNLGLEMHKDGDLDGAIHQYRIALAEKPEARGYFDLGSALEAQGEDAKALAAFREAVTLQPGMEEAHRALAVLYLKSGDFAQGEAAADEALANDDDDAEAYHVRGLIRFEAGRTAEAIEDWRRAYKLHPEDARYHAGMEQALAWRLATAAAAKERDCARAVQLAERACQATGNREPDFLDTLAAAYAECGRFADAVATGRQAALLATAAGRNSLAQRIEKHIRFYEARRPYRDPGASER